jgi:hypothetical protein
MSEITIGYDISEKEYRALPYPSYSLFSSIAKYGPEAMFGVKEDISDLDGIIIGSIADSKVTEHKDPDGLVVIDKKPSNKALKAIKKLCERDDLVDTKNILSVKNKAIVSEVCKEVDYYKTKDADGHVTALKKYKKYANALYSANGDTLFASKYQYDTATYLTKAIFSKYGFLKAQKDNIVGQSKFVGKIDGMDVKCMLDFILIDHARKLIVPFDLKTGIGEHHTFFETGYLGWGYYIQASLYRELLIQEIAKHPELSDYTVDNFRFLFCGRQDFLPVIYKVTDKQHKAGFDGFEHKGTYYPGIHELIADYEYYLSRPNSRYRRGYDQKEVIFDDSYLE